MRRRYNTGMALDALKALRSAMPDIQFTTDMMVGFPGESEAHFEETMAFCREAAFLDMHVFAYSRRPGTPAADFADQVPEEVKRERSARLIALKNEIRQEILSRTVQDAQPLSVLFETEEGGVYTGHTDTYMAVCAPCEADVRGEICAVTPREVRDGIIYGEIIK
jgi:threonylcarbamoyladenosine tRNA methylthiotransferase MtaB